MLLPRDVLRKTVRQAMSEPLVLAILNIDCGSTSVGLATVGRVKRNRRGKQN